MCFKEHQSRNLSSDGSRASGEAAREQRSRYSPRSDCVVHHVVFVLRTFISSASSTAVTGQLAPRKNKTVAAGVSFLSMEESSSRETAGQIIREGIAEDAKISMGATRMRKTKRRIREEEEEDDDDDEDSLMPTGVSATATAVELQHLVGRVADLQAFKLDDDDDNDNDERRRLRRDGCTRRPRELESINGVGRAGCHRRRRRRRRMSGAGGGELGGRGAVIPRPA